MEFKEIKIGEYFKFPHDSQVWKKLSDKFAMYAQNDGSSIRWGHNAGRLAFFGPSGTSFDCVPRTPIKLKEIIKYLQGNKQFREDYANSR